MLIFTVILVQVFAMSRDIKKQEQEWVSGWIRTIPANDIHYQHFSEVYEDVDLNYKEMFLKFLAVYMENINNFAEENLNLKTINEEMFDLLLDVDLEYSLAVGQILKGYVWDVDKEELVSTSTELSERFIDILNLYEEFGIRAPYRSEKD